MTPAPDAQTTVAPRADTRADTRPEPRTDDVTAVLVALQHLQSRIASVNDRMAKGMGVGATDYLALVHLSVHGDTPPKKVGEALGLSSGAMTALADRLEAAGLVVRLQHPTDRRSFVLALTAEGSSGVDEAGILYGRVVREALVAGDVVEVVGTHRSLLRELDRRMRELVLFVAGPCLCARFRCKDII